MIIVRVLSLISGIICSEYFFSIFQLKDYKISRYLNKLKKYNLVLILSIIFICLTPLQCINHFNLEILSAALLPLIFYHKKANKTPLICTTRIKIDYALYLIISICLTTISPIIYFGLYLYLPAISNTMNIFTNIKNIKLTQLASKKMKTSKAKVIAITGSNGKTTTKNILYQLLKTKYNVIASPKSFNTPLGNASFINKNLTDDTDFVILEYGARKRNDIKKLCDLFGADYGIITCIAPQHLEYFHSMENIFKAKKELSDYLLDRPCVYNLSNIYTLRMFKQKTGTKIGIKRKHIKISNFKSNFNLFSKKVSTSILGEDNILDILLASALAQKLGIDQNTISETIKNLQPVEHRLQYIKSRINILDDSYNCSLNSAKQSIDVLLNTQNKKMVVTPGIVEGGKNQYSINFSLGKMLQPIDYLLIVGNLNRDAILNGIHSSKSNCNVILVDTLDEAKSYFNILEENDTLLLLNDLPDGYD